MDFSNLPNPVQRPQKRASKHASLNAIFIKRGQSYEIQREVDAIDFIREHTSIPVPTILERYVDPNDTYNGSWFSMKQIPGLSLTDAWPSLDQEARETIYGDLRMYFEEMRAITTPTPISIGSCTGGPAYDHRLNNGFPCGPFASEAEFNDFLIAPVARCPRKELVSFYREQLKDHHEIVFTHADLDGDHILVDPSTGKVTGIIDWEMTGWWPAYWEYTKSRFGNRYQEWWVSLVGTVLHPYHDELRIECDLQEF